MAEELSNLYEGLSLTEEERQEVIIPFEEVLSSIEKSRNCLAAFIVAEKETNRGAFRNTMSKAWKVEGQVSFKNLGFNKYLVEFQNQLEKERVLAGRPWSFDRSLVCLFDCEGCVAPKDIVFKEEPFWIQLHDLPFAGMNKIMGEKVGAAAGTVVSVEVDESGMAWGHFLRVRVLLDIRKPLSRGRFINMEGKRFWIPFKYERLPLFCFQCGAIKHTGLSCPIPLSKSKGREEIRPQYGPWLRASSQLKSSPAFGKKEGDFENTGSWRQNKSDASRDEEDLMGQHVKCKSRVGVEQADFGSSDNYQPLGPFHVKSNRGRTEVQSDTHFQVNSDHLDTVHLMDDHSKESLSSKGALPQHDYMLDNTSQASPRPARDLTQGSPSSQNSPVKFNAVSTKKTKWKRRARELGPRVTHSPTDTVMYEPSGPKLKKRPNAEIQGFIMTRKRTKQAQLAVAGFQPCQSP